MRIAFDVSPLSHERTGVNNYIRGSLAGLADAAALEGDEVVAFAEPIGRPEDIAAATSRLLAALCTQFEQAGVGARKLEIALYRVDGPIVIRNQVTGLYPNDTWSGKTVTYRRFECTGGSLAVELQADQKLFKTPQTVIATEHGNPIGRTAIPVAGITTMTVPLVPRNGTCTVRFTVGRTAVPGPRDRRELGAHFLSFTPIR